MAVDGQRFMTKTQHYRKVTKPLLERKRRARMNLYLDELKDLIVDTMDAQDDQVSKLEKADILELTVNYLKAQQQQRGASSNPAAPQSSTPPPATPLNFDKFKAGYTQAAYEVSHIFSTVPGLDLKFGTHLMKQLGHQLKDMKHDLPSPTSNDEPELESEPELDLETTEPVNLSDRKPPSTSPLNAAAAEALDKLEDVWRPW